MYEKLSVVIITLNEEKNIGKCLDAAWQVADEIVVVDSYSTDKTKEICLDSGAVFLEHKFEGYIEQKNYAYKLAANNFILSIDADEVLSNELISSIRKIKENPIHDAYTVNRLSFYVDRFIKHGHWFPDKKIRLLKRGVGKLAGRNPHDHYELEDGSKAPLLRGVLYHYTFNSVSEHIQQSNNFSEIGATQLGKESLFFLIVKALISPIWGFFYGYIARLGFLDGWYGLNISIISSTETFFKYSKAITAQAKSTNIPAEAKTDFSVSLIISTYNWPEALKLCLESVKKQLLLPNEVIIADDGSGEETREIINAFKQDFPVPLIHSWIEDKGFRLSKSRNEALKKANCDYIVQIDGDIIMHENFIYDHAKFAKKGSFVRGSRVLLSETLSQKLFNGLIDAPNIFMPGTTNFFNGLRLPLTHSLLKLKSTSILGIRGCNMGYWKDDAFKINGYNEDIEGWGREDSEFVARLINIGVFKKVLRLGGIQYHIYHPEYDRKLLNKNDSILNKTIAENLKQCTHGISRIN